MRIMKYFIYLWDEFTNFGKKGISLHADAGEDPESNHCPSQHREFPPKTTQRQAAEPDRGQTKNS